MSIFITFLYLFMVGACPQSPLVSYPGRSLMNGLGTRLLADMCYTCTDCAHAVLMWPYSFWLRHWSQVSSIQTPSTLDVCLLVRLEIVVGTVDHRKHLQSSLLYPSTFFLLSYFTSPSSLDFSLPSWSSCLPPPTPFEAKPTCMHVSLAGC